MALDCICDSGNLLKFIWFKFCYVNSGKFWKDIASWYTMREDTMLQSLKCEVFYVRFKNSITILNFSKHLIITTGFDPVNIHFISLLQSKEAPFNVPVWDLEGSNLKDIESRKPSPNFNFVTDIKFTKCKVNFIF